MYAGKSAEDMYACKHFIHLCKLYMCTTVQLAYLFVLSHISNCQSLGRKNKHVILKTDRNHTNTTNNNTIV